jgi:hypothetical protein
MGKTIRNVESASLKHYLCISLRVSDTLWAFPKGYSILFRHGLQGLQQPLGAFISVSQNKLGILVQFV